MSIEFKPQYEEEAVKKLFSKIVKYVATPRYRDILYFFLTPHQVLRTVTTMSGERRFILIEAIGVVDEAKLLELRDLYYADFMEFLSTPLGSELLKRLSPEAVAGMEPQQYIALMQQVPELQSVLVEMSKSGIPVILPLSLYRSIAISIALSLHRMYMDQQFREKISAIVDILSRENLLEPIYQIEICYRKNCRYMQAIKVYTIDSMLPEFKFDRDIDLSKPYSMRHVLSHINSNNSCV